MQIKSINVTYARTFNLGDYNSMRLECAMAAELAEGDDPAQAEQRLWEMVKESVKAQAMPVLKRREDEIAAIRNSLPPEALGQ